MNRNILSKLRNIAKQRGGKLLDRKFSGLTHKYQWTCVNEHVWMASAMNVIGNKSKKGTWCPFCVSQKGISINDFRVIAKKHGGTCLSRKYINNKTKLKFRCKNGHTWKAIPTNIKRGHWCFQCYKNNRKGTSKYTISDFKIIAKRKKGVCLTTKLNSLNDSLTLKCNKGHVWTTKAKNLIQKKSWCAYCAPNAKVNFDDIKKHCSEFGYKLISRKYSGVKKAIKLKCSAGHKWSITWSNLRRGRGCPECSQGVGEKVTREILQYIFDKKFPKKKPVWLKTPSGRRLELDGYCKELGIAFEHQGIQHYKKNNFFHSNHRDFNKRLQYDVIKKKLCKEHKIILLEIPEIGTLTPMKDAPSLIKELLRKQSVRLPQKANKISISNFKNALLCDYELSELQQIADAFEIEILDKKWLGTKEKYRFQCRKCKEEWSTLYNFLRTKKFKGCPYCGKISSTLGYSFKSPRIVWDINRATETAKQMGYLLLNKKFRTVDHKYRFRCKLNHTWSAVFYSVIKSGTGCPKCFEIKKQAKQISILKKAGFTIQRRLNRRILLKCRHKHTFWRGNGWSRGKKVCPICNKKNNYTLNLKQAKFLTKNKDGKVLTRKITSSTSKFKIQCKHKHIWRASLTSLKTNRWCPKCSVKKPKKHSLESVSQKSRQLGFILLSKNYQNTKDHLLFICKNGHKFKKSYCKLLAGQGCPVCKKR